MRLLVLFGEGLAGIVVVVILDLPVVAGVPIEVDHIEDLSINFPGEKAEDLVEGVGGELLGECN